MFRKSVVLLALWLGLCPLGCGGGGSDDNNQNADSGADGDTDTDADGDGDADAGADTDTDVDADADSGPSADAGPPPAAFCPFECLTNYGGNQCTNNGGTVVDGLVCPNDNQVCCNLNGTCEYVCVSESLCDTDLPGVSVHADTACLDIGIGPPDNRVCCEGIQKCDTTLYSCVDPTDCIAGYGHQLVADQVCDSQFGTEVCCDRGPRCAFECIWSFTGDCPTGSEARTGFCDNANQVCCEPGETPCSPSNDCIPDRQCPTDRRVADSYCSDTGDVCCAPAN